MKEKGRHLQEGSSVRYVASYHEKRPRTLNEKKGKEGNHEQEASMYSSNRNRAHS